jgi:hypothetical protein
MRIPKKDIIDVGEYKILIDYDGYGRLEIMVLDELGDEIEGLEIYDADDDDNLSTDLDINLN